MMTTDIRVGAGRRNVAAGLLFVGVAIALLLVSGSKAYAKEAPTATPADTTESTPVATEDTSTATTPQEGSGSTDDSGDATTAEPAPEPDTTEPAPAADDSTGTPAPETEADPAAPAAETAETDAAAPAAATSEEASAATPAAEDSAQASDGAAPAGSVQEAERPITLVNQTVTVGNDGTATANTGGNAAMGNQVRIHAPVNQVVRLFGIFRGQVTIRIVNVQDVTNNLDGSASVDTGDANATGNTATTNVSQLQTPSGGSGGSSSATGQSVAVTNRGDAIANTGNNTVIGNDVAINAPAVQEVRNNGPPGSASDITLTNDQQSTNDMDGTADAVTGDADAGGNTSTTSADQAAGTGSAFQAVEVGNTGDATANTGNNTVIGNNLVINMPVNQEVKLFGIFEGDVTIYLTNNQTITNNLTGNASLVTGNATATGNASNTSITQAAGSASARDTKGGTGHETVKRAIKYGGGDVAHVRARARGASGGRVSTSGEGRALPRTGGSLAVQALAGLLLIALGGLARRSARTA